MREYHKFHVFVGDEDSTTATTHRSHGKLTHVGYKSPSYLDVQLGLETGTQLAGIELGVAAGGEVDAGRSQRLHFHLHAAIVEPFAEQVTGRLAEIWKEGI